MAEAKLIQMLERQQILIKRGQTDSRSVRVKKKSMDKRVMFEDEPASANQGGSEPEPSPEGGSVSVPLKDGCPCSWDSAEVQYLIRSFLLCPNTVMYRRTGDVPE